MSHCEIPPHAAAIWGADTGCTGWVVMTRSYPKAEQSLYQLEGNAAHEIAAELLIARLNNRVMPEMIGRAASNGVSYTPQMLQAAAAYVEEAANIIEMPGIIYGVEERIECSRIHNSSTAAVDLYAYNPLSKILYIWDFKNGYSIIEPYENYQLINYAAGLIEHLKLDIKKISVSMRITQPNAHHRDGITREWRVPGTHLIPYFDELSRNAIKSLGENAEFNTGTHCYRCPGRHACPAALQAGTSLYEAAGAATPLELSPAALGVQLTILRRARKQLQELESAFEAQAVAVIEKGERVHGWNLTKGKGKLSWSQDVEHITALGDEHGIDLRQPRSVVTPTQAIAAGIDSEIISQYSTRVTPGYKLVQEELNETKRIFNNDY